MSKQIFSEGVCVPPTVGKEELLGKGTCGTVVKVYVSDPGGFSRLQAGQYIADKKIAMTNFHPASPYLRTTLGKVEEDQGDEDGGGGEDDERFEGIRREITMLKTLRHKNIVEYYGVHLDTTAGYLHIYLEYCEGNSIRHVYKKNGPLGDAVVQSYTYQVLEGLKFLHARGVVHRDIKGFNVLLSRNGDCKLADFGSAINLANKKDQQFQSVEGTVYWMAPEVLQIGSHTQGASFAADLWSVGCTVLEMLTAATPFCHCKGDYMLVKHVLETPEEDLILPEVVEAISSEALHFLRRCLKRDPKERPTAAQLQEDPYFKSFLERRRVQQPDINNNSSSLGEQPGEGSFPDCEGQLQQQESRGATGGSPVAAPTSSLLLASKEVKPKMQPAYQWWVQEATQGTGSITAGELFANHFKCPSLLPELLPILKYRPGSRNICPLQGEADRSTTDETVLVTSDDFLRFMEWFGPLRTFLQDCSMFDAQAQEEAKVGGGGGNAPMVGLGGGGGSDSYGGTYGGAYGYGSYGNDDDVHMLLTLKTRSWFQPLLNQKEAERAILPQPTETFALRFSSRYDQHPGSFTLSIRGKGGVNHYRILRPVEQDSWAFVLVICEAATGGGGQMSSTNLDGSTSFANGGNSTVILPSGGRGLYFDSLENLVVYGKKYGIPSLKHPDQVYKFTHPLPSPK